MSIRRATLHDLFQHCDRLAKQEQRLRPGRPPLAALDADGTLWRPDVAELLWRRLLREKALARGATAPIARALRSCGGDPARDPYIDYPRFEELHRAGRCPEETMVRVMLQGLAGIREEDLYAHCVEAIATASDLSDLALGGARQTVAKLRGLGFRVIVVSGSPRWAVEVAVRPLGVEPRDVLAGQVPVVEAVLTDGIIEPLPHGKGKVHAILRRFGSVPRVSMGNGLGDLAMLEATSDLRILVNPSDELVLACEEIRGATWSLGALAAAPAARRRAAAAAAVSQAGGQPGARAARRPSAQT